MLNQSGEEFATLPFSSLLQLEQSIQRTQQLLAQAQRIAYDIPADRSCILHDLRTVHRQAFQTRRLIANAQTRWQNAMAGLQDAMRTQATVVR